jgi:hypothetical protein
VRKNVDTTCIQVHPSDTIGRFQGKAGFNLNGRLFVINNELLVILWHKGKNRTAGCFSAIEKALDTYSEKRR